MLYGIKVVFLDIDNTLLDFNVASRLSMEKAFAECRLPFRPEWYPVFQRVNDGLWHRIENGTLTREELHRTRWSLVLRELRIEANGPMVEERFLEHLATEAVPIDGAYEVLRYLFPKYTVCIASNAPYEQQLKRLASVDMLPYFHKAFISEKMGCAKPNRGFFDACFAELGNVLPEECMMIGDSQTADIRGGAAYGLHTCWYDRNCTGQKPKDAEYVVTNLREICELL